MSDFRIQVERINRSQTASGITINTGAMGIRSKRKRMEATFIQKNRENDIVDLYGIPSVNHPDVEEAIRYNKVEGLWLFSPHLSDAELGGVLVRKAGVVALSEGIDPSDIKHTFVEDDYFVIYSKFVVEDEDDLSISAIYNTTNNVFNITLFKDEREIDTYVVSLEEGKKDGFGRIIDIRTVFEDNPYVGIIMNEEYDFDGFTAPASPVAFGGNDEGETGTISAQMVIGWKQFNDTNKYNIKVAMDPTADPAVIAEFDTLRTSGQKYCRYICILPIGENATTSITTKDTYGINNYGLAFYCNHARVRNSYTGGSFWTSLAGRIGAKFAEMAPIFNSGNPAFEDEQGFGGYLGGGIIELDQAYTDGDLQALDQNGINPIVVEPGVGAIIAGGKSGQNPTNLDDYSFIAHVGMFDYIIENVINQVLKPQRGKLNDIFHRDAAAVRSDLILSPIVSSSYLDSYRIICDTSNNTNEVLARREFVLTIVVKVTPFSEKLILKFANIGQTTTVDAFVG